VSTRGYSSPAPKREVGLEGCHAIVGDLNSPTKGSSACNFATTTGVHVLMLLDFERAELIGKSWSYPQSRAFAELLIECERIGRSGRCSLVCCGKATAKADEHS